MEITPEYIRQRWKMHRWYETLLKNNRIRNHFALKGGAISQPVYDVLMKDMPIMEEGNRIDGRIIDLLEREMLGIATWEDTEELEQLQEQFASTPLLDTKDLDELVEKYGTGSPPKGKVAVVKPVPLKPKGTKKQRPKAKK
jgi:hypothetical protein